MAPTASEELPALPMQQLKYVRLAERRLVRSEHRKQPSRHMHFEFKTANILCDSINKDDPPQIDPFWQTTPRTGAPVLDAIMSVLQSAPTPPKHNIPPAATPMRQLSRPLRRPQCTHITMERKYGDATCSMCGREPFFGWLYVCSQDQLPAQLEPLPDIDGVPLVASLETDPLESKARVAEYLKMSPFVIKGIRAGDYNADQVEKLIGQREYLRILAQ